MKINLINVEKNLFIINNISSSKSTNKLKINRYYNFIKKTKIIIKNNKYLFSYLISYLLYFLSLEKCYEGEDACCIKINWIILKIVELIISCLKAKYNSYIHCFSFILYI